jgi:hypothetical protein
MRLFAIDHSPTLNRIDFNVDGTAVLLAAALVSTTARQDELAAMALILTGLGSWITKRKHWRTYHHLSDQAPDDGVTSALKDHVVRTTHSCPPRIANGSTEAPSAASAGQGGTALPMHFAGHKAMPCDDSLELDARIEANPVAEWQVVENRTQIIAPISEQDSSTRRLLVDVLSDEQEHAAKLKDSLAD